MKANDLEPFDLLVTIRGPRAVVASDANTEFSRTSSRFPKKNKWISLRTASDEPKQRARIMRARALSAFAFSFSFNELRTKPKAVDGTHARSHTHSRHASQKRRTDDKEVESSGVLDDFEVVRSSGSTRMSTRHGDVFRRAIAPERAYFLCRWRFRSLRCLCFRIFFRRFLMTLPMWAPSLLRVADPRGSVCASGDAAVERRALRASRHRLASAPGRVEMCELECLRSAPIEVRGRRSTLPCSQRFARPAV